MEEDIITENEMDEIVSFIAGMTYEQYQYDREIREALLLIKSKMIKEEEEKQKRMKEEFENEKKQIKEDEEQNNNNNELNKKTIINYSDEINLKNSNQKIAPCDKELTFEEKTILEKNWNNSVNIFLNKKIQTKLEEGDKVINSIGDKEILINPESNGKLVSL